MESRSSLYLPLGRRSSNKAPSSAHMTELTNQLYLVEVKGSRRGEDPQELPQGDADQVFDGTRGAESHRTLPPPSRN